MARVLTSEEKVQLKAETASAARALVEDLADLRAIVAEDDPKPKDIRRFSAQMRRILTEGDLRKVAAPRVGRIEIDAPDLRLLYRSNEQWPILFASAELVTMHGILTSAIVFDKFDRPDQARDLEALNLDARVLLTPENFLAQRVICYEGKWVTRGDIIKYVAIVAHGVHSEDASKYPSWQLLRKVRHAVVRTLKDDMPNFEINEAAYGLDDPAIYEGPDRWDMALVPLVSTAQLLTASPQVVELEAIIRASG
jgi:hypothetical protein